MVLGERTNPWLKVPSVPPYVLPCDAGAIQAYNLHAAENYRIQCDLLPEPFIGITSAPVVLLSGNPGFDETDLQAHSDPRFRSAIRENHAQARLTYPFYYLDSSLESPGRIWWETKLKSLLNIFDPEHLSRALLCVEFFPYHSRKYRHADVNLPSQEYGFDLIRQAISRKAFIVKMRGTNNWLDRVPELEEYPRTVALNSWQNVAISPRNCPEFISLVSVIRQYIEAAS
jgi:hypothetical protein